MADWDEILDAPRKAQLRKQEEQEVKEAARRLRPYIIKLPSSYLEIRNFQRDLERVLNSID